MGSLAKALSCILVDSETAVTQPLFLCLKYMMPLLQRKHFVLKIYKRPKLDSLTVRCWKSQALIIFVATLGKMPRFFCLFLSWSSSSPVPGDAKLLSRVSPMIRDKRRVHFILSPSQKHVPEVLTEEDCTTPWNNSTKFFLSPGNLRH